MTGLNHSLALACVVLLGQSTRDFGTKNTGFPFTFLKDLTGVRHSAEALHDLYITTRELRPEPTRDVSTTRSVGYVQVPLRYLIRGSLLPAALPCVIRNVINVQTSVKHCDPMHARI